LHDRFPPNKKNTSVNFPVTWARTARANEIELPNTILSTNLKFTGWTWRITRLNFPSELTRTSRIFRTIDYTSSFSTFCRNCVNDIPLHRYWKIATSSCSHFLQILHGLNLILKIQNVPIWQENELLLRFSNHFSKWFKWYIVHR
jgi:hypothetical protein